MSADHPFPKDYRPRLRPKLAAALAGPNSDDIVLYDPNRLSPSVVTLPKRKLAWVELFTGQRTLAQIQLELMAIEGGVLVTRDEIAALVALLDEALFLDSPALRAYLTGRTRRPACVGVYPDDPDAIREALQPLFTGPGGPGLPTRTAPSPHGKLRAALLPHMDYARGGITYGWGFKELVEQTTARLFVVVATSHYSPHRFTLTRMNFATPLGTAETDQSYVDRLVKHYGDGLFDDPVAHLPEHSIELEVVLLQYLLEHRPEPFRIVPLLVGSFGDCVDAGRPPSDAADISRMVSALRKAEEEAGEEVCYLISGDLAHIGPKFRDPKPVDEPWLKVSRSQDEKILDQLAAADPTGYFDVIAAEGDERRICGLPPTWLTLAAVRPLHGRVLHYNQYAHPTGHESVSFASAAFYE